MERRFAWPVLIAALLVIPIIALEDAHLGEPWDTLASVGNWLIWLTFAAELVAMLAVVPDRRRWMRKHPHRRDRGGAHAARRSAWASVLAAASTAATRAGVHAGPSDVLTRGRDGRRVPRGVHGGRWRADVRGR
jgi:hypothetical protein